MLWGLAWHMPDVEFVPSFKDEVAQAALSKLATFTPQVTAPIVFFPRKGAPPRFHLSQLGIRPHPLSGARVAAGPIKCHAGVCQLQRRPACAFLRGGATDAALLPPIQRAGSAAKAALMRCLGMARRALLFSSPSCRGAVGLTPRRLSLRRTWQTSPAPSAAWATHPARPCLGRWRSFCTPTSTPSAPRSCRSCAWPWHGATSHGPSAAIKSDLARYRKGKERESERRNLTSS